MNTIVRIAAALLLVLSASGCGSAGDTRSDAASAGGTRERPTPMRATLGPEYLVVREAPRGSIASRDYVTLGASRELADTLTTNVDALASIPDEVGIRLDRSSYGRGWWALCMGHVDVGLLDHRAGGANGLQSCEKTGIWVLVLPFGPDQWLYVNSRGAMRPEVAAYVDRLLEPGAHAAARGAWIDFQAHHRAAGTVPME